MTETTTTQSDLPSRNWGWDTDSPRNHTFDGVDVTIIQPEPTENTRGDRIDLGGDKYDNRLGAHTCGILVDGLTEFKNKFGFRKIRTPTTLSDINHDTVYYRGIETTGGSHKSYGNGITGLRLENAIRFAAGGGRYRSSDLTITACSNHLFLVQYDGTAYVVVQEFVGEPDEYSATAEIHGIEVYGEEDQKRLDATEKLLEFLETYTDIIVTGYAGRTATKLQFTTERGKTLGIDPNDATSLNHFETDPTEVLGTHTYETLRDDIVEYTWDEIHFDVGEQRSDEVFAGFRLGTNRTLGNVTDSYSVTLNAEYLSYKLNESDSTITVSSPSMHRTNRRLKYQRWDDEGTVVRSET